MGRNKSLSSVLSQSWGSIEHAQSYQVIAHLKIEMGCTHVLCKVGYGC